MKEYQFYGIITAIWSCGIAVSNNATSWKICAALTFINLAFMLFAKDK